MSGEDDRFREALRLAAVVHDGQMWKGTPVPYLVHVVQVACLLDRHGAPEPLVLAGLLHDTLEDLDDTPDVRARLHAVVPAIDADVASADLAASVARWIAVRFGEDVRRLVEAVTVPASDDETPAQRRARRERQVAHLRDASDDVVWLKAADTRANAEALADALALPAIAADMHAHVPVGDLVAYYAAITDLVARRLGEETPMAVALIRAIERLQRVA